MTNKYSSPLGILLVNLGTPDAPTTSAIRRYLAEFLIDPRVVTIPRLIWLPILYGFILPFRPRKLVRSYTAIWGDDAPIRSFTTQLAQHVNQTLANKLLARQTIVKAAMTYGNPSIADTLRELEDEGARDIMVIPLFPQYSAATSAAVFDKLASIIAQSKILPNFRYITDYHNDTNYIHAVTKSIEPTVMKGLASDEKLIFSFHGLPEAQIAMGDPYADQCEFTAKAVADNLGLSDDQWQLTYQSRFGPAPWIKPYTIEVLAALPAQGIKKVFVVCPGFAVDCLETLEEIEVLNKGVFLEAGGQAYTYIPALNAGNSHVDMISKMIMAHMYEGEVNNRVSI